MTLWLQRYRVSHKVRPQHHLVCRYPSNAKLIEDASRHQVPEKLERALTSSACQGIRVHMACAGRQVIDAKPVEVASSLGEDAAKLLVVALGFGLLVRAHRIAVKHPAAPMPFLQRSMPSQSSNSTPLSHRSSPNTAPKASGEPKGPSR